MALVSSLRRIRFSATLRRASGKKRASMRSAPGSKARSPRCPITPKKSHASAQNSPRFSTDHRCSDEKSSTGAPCRSRTWAMNDVMAEPSTAAADGSQSLRVAMGQSGRGVATPPNDLPVATARVPLRQWQLPRPTGGDHHRGRHRGARNPHRVAREVRHGHGHADHCGADHGAVRVGGGRRGGHRRADGRVERMAGLARASASARDPGSRPTCALRDHGCGTRCVPARRLTRAGRDGRARDDGAGLRGAVSHGTRHQGRFWDIGQVVTRRRFRRRRVAGQHRNLGTDRRHVDPRLSTRPGRAHIRGHPAVRHHRARPAHGVRGRRPALRSRRPGGPHVHPSLRHGPLRWRIAETHERRGVRPGRPCHALGVGCRSRGPRRQLERAA